MKKNILTILVCSFVLFGCADQLEITPPNKITDEQIMQLLESGNSESIKIVLGSMANELPLLFKSSGIQGQGSADGRYYTCQGLDVMRNLLGNDIVFGTKLRRMHSEPMNTIFGILRQVPSIKIFLIGIMPGNVFLQPINC